jgi:hypothetical protein
MVRTLDEFETIVEFQPTAKADAEFRAWRENHDISRLAPTDIIVDTGRGECEGKICDVRRYRISRKMISDILVRDAG